MWSSNRLDYEKLRQDVELFQDPETLRNVLGKQAVILMDMMRTKRPFSKQNVVDAELNNNIKKMAVIFQDRTGVLFRNIHDDDMKVEKKFNPKAILRVFEGMLSAIEYPVDKSMDTKRIDDRLSEVFAIASCKSVHLLGAFEEKLNVYVYYLRRYQALVAQPDFDMDQAYNLAATCIVKATTLGMWLDVKI